MIKIVVDAASDITKEEALEKKVDVLPIEITLGSKIYIEGENITRDAFYEMMISQKDFAKTSLVSPQKFVEYFEEQMKQHNEVIYIGLSSKLSGTFNSANLAKQELKSENIYLVDSLSASYAIKILVDTAILMMDMGKTAEEIFNFFTNIISYDIDLILLKPFKIISFNEILQ